MWQAATRIFTLLLGVVAVGGCATSYELTPTGDQVRWSRGQAMQQVEAAGAMVTVAFLEARGERLLFSLEVENRSDRDLLVAPELLYYEVLEMREQPVGTTRTAGFRAEPLGRIMAIDPEDELAKLRGWGALGSAPAPPLREGEPAGEGRDRLRPLQREARWWRDAALRKTTLAPGDQVGGVVVFPAEKRVARLRLFLPCGEQALGFDFAQTRR